MRYNFNVLEHRAKELIQLGRIEDAVCVYLFMADGDGSLDGGYLGHKLATCYDSLGRLHEAKYRHGRASEENPAVYGDYTATIDRLSHINIEAIIPISQYLMD